MLWIFQKSFSMGDDCIVAGNQAWHMIEVVAELVK